MLNISRALQHLLEALETFWRKPDLTPSLIEQVKKAAEYSDVALPKVWLAVRQGRLIDLTGSMLEQMGSFEDAADTILYRRRQPPEEDAMRDELAKYGVKNQFNRALRAMRAGERQAAPVILKLPEGYLVLWGSWIIAAAMVQDVPIKALEVDLTTHLPTALPKTPYKKPQLPSGVEPWQLTLSQFYKIYLKPRQADVTYWQDLPEAERLKIKARIKRQVDALSHRAKQGPFKARWQDEIVTVLRPHGEESNIELPDVEQKPLEGLLIRYANGEEAVIVQLYGLRDLHTGKAFVERIPYPSRPTMDPIVRTIHKQAVERALADGKDVPKEVTADYPDLRFRYGGW